MPRAGDGFRDVVAFFAAAFCFQRSDLRYSDCDPVSERIYHLRANVVNQRIWEVVSVASTAQSEG